MSVAGKELEEAGSKFHARVDLLNLKRISFSASEKDTVNLESDTFKRNAKKVYCIYAKLLVFGRRQCVG